MNQDEKNKLILELLESNNKELDNEELIHLLINHKMTGREDDEMITRPQRAADAIARFTGSWTFIIIFILTLISWMSLNVWLAKRCFDAYPFILLNLVLSCIAAIQAPLILMSQNRQESKDRVRSENDYRVNLKNEIVINDLHYKIDSIIENQNEILNILKEQAKEGRQAD